MNAPKRYAIVSLARRTPPHSLWGCLGFFRSRLAEDAALAEDGAALAGLVAETVGRQLLFILITVDDELSAYTVFETLGLSSVSSSCFVCGR